MKTPSPTLWRKTERYTHLIDTISNKTQDILNIEIFIEDVYLKISSVNEKRYLLYFFKPNSPFTYLLSFTTFLQYLKHGIL